MIDWFPLWLSLRVAALATLFVLTVGTLVAYLLSHKSFPGKNLVDSLITPLGFAPYGAGLLPASYCGQAFPSRTVI
jgi:molybdate transport system permease protein